MDAEAVAAAKAGPGDSKADQDSARAVAPAAFRVAPAVLIRTWAATWVPVGRAASTLWRVVWGAISWAAAAVAADAGGPAAWVTPGS